MARYLMKMKKLMTISIGLLLVFSTFITVTGAMAIFIPPDEPPEFVKFSGYVRDYTTGNAISGASVKFYYGSNLIVETTTSSSGYYVILAQYSTYTHVLKASKAGYYLESKNVVPSRSRGVTFYLKSTSSVSGHVTDDSSDEPVTGATVTIYYNGVQKSQTTTDSNGYYKLLYISPNTYTVEVTHVDYHTASKNENTAVTSTIDFQMELLNPPPPPPPPPTWRVTITNPLSEDILYVQVFIDEKYRDCFNLYSLSSQQRVYDVSEGLHTLHVMYWDARTRRNIRSELTDYVSGDTSGAISLNPSPGTTGIKYFDVILVKTTDGTSGYDYQAIKSAVYATALKLEALYYEFSYGQFTYKLRSVLRDWYNSTMSSAQADDDHTGLWSDAIQLADSDHNFYLTDSVMVVYTSNNAKASGGPDENYTNDGWGYTISGKVVVSSNFAFLESEWVWAHEFGHTLALGHPDSYNEPYIAHNWELMGGNEAHMNSYYKWQLGWLNIDLKERGQYYGYTPTALTDLQFGGLMIAYKTVSNSANEFYIVEYRDVDDPHDGVKTDRDAVIIYKTTSSSETQDGYNDLYYDTGLYYFETIFKSGLTVVKYWDPPPSPYENSFPHTFIDYEDGFTVTIDWKFSLAGSLLAPFIQLNS